ncbi:MAG: hypothetical protein Harvfovirus27_22 [Harvfovirus sp.]|uniref:C2H2-type domain-containing protein n=1 Tax=Harvfovirus sp. TaxID=2487768 RepID=A0A3G5A684_9VIRU|nr:MAG: hypothetical protein Harvfovirus27_22 [Harvfovirus sp.]
MAKLRGFWLRENAIHPFYMMPCDVCSADLSVYGYAIEIDKLAILDRTPDEIIRLDEAERAHLRSLLRDRHVDRIPCMHPLKEIGDDQPPKEAISISSEISMFDLCGCGQSDVMRILRNRKKSYTCVFCPKILCDEKCFNNHMERDHVNVNRLIDKSLVGGEWCPLCRKIFKKGREFLCDDDDKQCTIIVEKELLNLKDSARLEKYAIKNTLCPRCSQWDENKMMIIPTIILEKLRRFLYIFPADAWTPPYFSQQSIHFFDLAFITAYDDHPQFFVDLLKHSVLYKISDSSLCPQRTRAIMYPYLNSVWFTILSHNDTNKKFRLHTAEKVKATCIPGTKFLTAIRAEIAGLEACFTKTGILSDLCLIIRDYLPWQLWNVERILTRIHNDITRYAPSLAALLSIIGPLHD